MVILCDCLHEEEARNKEGREGGRLQGSAILNGLSKDVGKIRLNS